MKKIRLSPSMLKDFKAYQNKMFCGFLFDALYISRTVIIDPTPSMQMGQFFEWIAIGSLPRDISDPAILIIPGLKIAGKKKVDVLIPELIKASQNSEEIPFELINDGLEYFQIKYYNLLIQADHFKKTLQHYKIEILSIQKTIQFDKEDYLRKGVLDIHARIHKMPDETGGYFKPFEAIIDIKSTGNINNRWEDYGWDLLSLPFKEKIMMQPKEYTMIWRLKYNKEIPFFFFVHANTNEYSRKIIKVNIYPGILQEHNEWVKSVPEIIKGEIFLGFTPYPDVEKCYDCPLRNKCVYRADHPKIHTIELI